MAFKHKLKSPKGYILAAKFKVLKPPSETTYVTLEKGNKMDVKEFHKRIGHPSEEVTRATAGNMGVELTGKYEVCEDCALAKSRRKPIPKEAENKAKDPGERMSVDLSSIAVPSYGGAKY